MTKTLKVKNYRWILVAGAIMALILGAGAIYAQGYGNKGGGRNNPGQGGRGGRMGQRMGRSQDGMKGGPRLGGLMYLMQDPEIRETMMEIRAISAINEMGLDKTQVEGLLKDARDAQGLVNDKFGSAREDVKGVLKDQLDAVAKGSTFDPDAFKDIRDKAMGQNPGEVKDQLKPILEHAMGLLTDDQKAKFAEPGMGKFDGEGMGKDQGQDQGQGYRPRMRNRFNQGQGQDQDNGQGQVRERGDMKMSMFLMNPKSIPAMEKWLSAH